MNKIIIKELIVVEGKTDISFISSKIDAFFYRTNGYAITKKDLEFLKLSNKYCGIILLLDPDGPGIKTKEKIMNYVGDCKQVVLEKKRCIKHNKVGVAESDINETKNKIIEVATILEKKEINFSKEELNSLNLINNENSKNTRNKIGEYLGLKIYNSKDLFLKLNCIKINKEDLIKHVK